MTLFEGDGFFRISTQLIADSRRAAVENMILMSSDRIKYSNMTSYKYFFTFELSKLYFHAEKELSNFISSSFLAFKCIQS